MGEVFWLAVTAIGSVFALCFVGYVGLVAIHKATDMDRDRKR